MKFTAILLLVAALQVSAKSYAQQVTLSVKGIPLEQVFRAIKQQTGYSFVYNDRLMRNTKPVTLQVSKAPLEDVLRTCFRDQPVTYEIAGKIIIVKPVMTFVQETAPEAPAPPGQVKGYVAGDNGPIAGANVVVKRLGQGTSTNIKGEFTLNNVDDNDVLVVSCIGYTTQEITVKGKNGFIAVQLKLSADKLDEIQILAYGGTTTRRISTGSVTRVTGEDIAKQPVPNVLQAIAGRMPGILVTQITGTPGGDINFQVRGQNSIAGNTYSHLNNPLVIVDGVPYPNSPVNFYINSGTSMFSQFFSPAGYGSPLYNLNPADIESLEVLKDADAAAIYGSRAANGVMLITTKKGKQGKTRTEFNVRTGISTNLQRVDLLNTPEYLALRREAFKNAGITPTPSNAPDLFMWDSTTTTDWQKELIGGTARITDANVSFSGGGGGTSFLLSGNYNKQTTIFPGDRDVKKGTMHLNVNHTSANRKLQVSVSIMAAATRSNLPLSNFPYLAYSLAPNFPVYDSTGKFNWVGGTNPYATLLATYANKNQSLTGNIQVKYNILDGLNARISLGYTRVQTNEDQQYTMESQGPSVPVNSHSMSINTATTTMVEPQLEYVRDVLGGRLSLLAGGTIQKNINESPIGVGGYLYSSDLLVSNLPLASVFLVYQGYNAYQYASVFGRLNYNWHNRYIINGSFRRDGSSKFGPGSLFGNFGAIGGAWLFSNESFMKKVSWLSFGKLRGSIGWVGSDNIPNYSFIPTYSTTRQYNGQSGLAPARISNPNYRWETTQKLEAAAELGFLSDRILLTAAWFRNRSGNQLVGYPLSSQAGFTSYSANLNAVVENTGWELELNTTNIKTKNFTWTTAINVTIPANKLISFPGIESTAYASVYAKGMPLGALFALHYTGNDANGQPVYEDANKDGKIGDRSGLAVYGKGDMVYSGNTYPKHYGGINNAVTFKNFRLDVFLQYMYGMKKPDYLAAGAYPGTLNAMSRKAVDEIRALGLEKSFIMPSSNNTSGLLRNYSDVVYSDASFLRLQNVAFSWNLPEKYLKPLHMADARVYLQAQNLFKWHRYNGLSPEAGALNLAPLFTLTGGVQFSF